MTRDLEPFTVADIRTYGDTVVLISTDGCIFHRDISVFTRTPKVGDNLQLESIGCRVTGLYDPTCGSWLFRWSDDDLAAQDTAVQDTATTTHRRHN